MSSTDEDEKRGDERPMLILGEDRPDVEDTTPEELRRQQEEAQREIAEARRRAQEEIERRRREAEREIAELERAKEREIRERQRQLDQTERTLYKRESRLRRKVSSSGGTPKARLVQKPPRVPLSKKGLRRSGAAITLAAGAGVALVLGLLGAVPGVSPEVRSEIVDLDRSRVLWLQSGMAADELIAQRMAGQEVTPDADGTWPNVALAQEASAVHDNEMYAERSAERTEQMLDEGTSDVRALSLWTEVHRETSYAVGSWEVKDLVEDARGPGGWSYFLVALGVLGLVSLAVLSLVARSWASLPVLVVAAGLAVAALSVVAAGDGVAREAAAAHEAADDALDEIHDQVGRDLEVAYGISTSVYSYRTEFWTRDPFYGEGPPTAGEYVAARHDMADAMEAGDEQAVAEAAVGLVETARQAFDAQVPAMESARGRLVGTMAGSRSDWGLGMGLGAGAAVLGGVGLALSRGRGRTA